MPAFQFVPQRKWFRLKPGRFVDEEDSLSQSENNGFLEDDEDNNSSTTETFGGESQSTSNDDHLFSIGWTNTMKSGMAVDYTIILNIPYPLHTNQRQHLYSVLLADNVMTTFRTLSIYLYIIIITTYTAWG